MDKFVHISQPVLVAPLDRQNITDISAHFKWKTTEGNEYEIQLATEPEFIKPIVTIVPKYDADVGFCLPES